MLLRMLALGLILNTPVAHSWERLENKNIPGLDFENLPDIDSEQCESECMARPQCNAYTWVPVSERHAESACWLKWGISQINEVEGLVSGIRPEALTGTNFIDLPNRNLGGPDYRMLPRVSSSTCFTSCRDDRECSAYTWVPSATNSRLGNCWIKGALSQSNNPNDHVQGYISGARPFRTRIPLAPPPSDAPDMAAMLASAPPARTGPPERHVFMISPTTAAERFLGSVAREHAAAFRARGHEVTEIRSGGADEIINRLSALVLAAPENSQVIVGLECHGSLPPAGHPEQHTCNLGNDYIDWRSHLTAAQLLKIGALAKERHIRFGIIDTSCFGGNTVHTFETQPETCVVSTTAHNNVSAGGSLTPAAIRNRTNTNLSSLAGSISPGIASLSNWLPLLTTAFVSGCHQPWMNLRGGLANGYLSQSDWNGRAWAIFRSLSRWRGHPGADPLQRLSGDIPRLSGESCQGINEAAQAQALLETYVDTHSAILEDRFTQEFPVLRRHYIAVGLRVPATITSYAALMAKINELINQIYTRRDSQFTLLERFNAMPTSNSSGLASLRQEILREHARLLGVYTALSPLLSIAQELDCSTRELACSNISL